MAQLKTARKRQNDRKSFYCVYSRTNESRSVKLTIAYWLSFFLSFFFLGHRKLLLFWQKFGVFVFVRAHFVSATLLPTFVCRDQLHKTLLLPKLSNGRLFPFFHLFNPVDCMSKICKLYWIRIVDLWYWKQLLYQLIHNYLNCWICNLNQKFRVTRLTLTKKLFDHWSGFDSQKHGKNMKNSARVSLTRLGYSDVAIAKKIRETRMQSCAKDLRQRLFRCSHCE